MTQVWAKVKKRIDIWRDFYLIKIWIKFDVPGAPWSTLNQARPACGGALGFTK
jgi:hypothetical protein